MFEELSTTDKIFTVHKLLTEAHFERSFALRTGDVYQDDSSKSDQTENVVY